MTSEIVPFEDESSEFQGSFSMEEENSCEIVAFEDEGSEPPSVDISKASNAVCHRPQGSCSMEEDIRAFDRLKLRQTWNLLSQFKLIGGDYHTRKFLESEKGHSYLTKYDPDLAYVKGLVKKIKEPSVLLIRGCELFFQPDVPSEKFKTLMNLEISGCNNVTTLTKNTISEMTQLQSLTLSHLPIKQLPDDFFSNLTNLSTLNLSHLPIKQLPDDFFSNLTNITTLNLSHLPIKQLPDDFFSNLTNLTTLVLKGCSNLHSLPKFLQLTQLSYLQLSHLPIQTLPEGFSDLWKIAYLIISGCSQLSSLPSIGIWWDLKVLDLSHCTTLQEIGSFLENLEYLKTLDLSYIALPRIPLDLTQAFYLANLFLRDVDIGGIDSLPRDLKVLDFSGAKNVRLIDLLKNTKKLRSLDLSRTDIETIDIISNQTQLRHLILQDCTRLIKLPPMKELTNLEVLDISGCEILDDLPEDLSYLTNLKEFNLSRCSGLTELRKDVFDQLTCLEKLDLSKTQLKCPPSFANLTPRGCDEIDFKALEDSSKGLQGSTSKPNEFHLVSTFITKSGFDRFRYELTKLNDRVSNIQLKSLNADIKKQLRNMPGDLKYILEKIDLLESSTNRSSIEKLLNCLMDFATTNDDYPLADSTNLTQLIRTVTKLKLLVPRKPMNDLEKEKVFSNHNMHKKKPVVVPEIDLTTPAMQALLSSYKSLTDIQRNCLLYFALLPWWKNNFYHYLDENIFIALWYGEGFIDPEHEENVAFSCSSPNPETGSNENKSEAEKDARQRVSTSKGVKNPNKILETGQQILKVLEEKGFISREGSHYMELQPGVVRFLVTQAKEECFFDFDCIDGEGNTLTPQFTGSKRACLLPSRHNAPSSCAVWMNDTIKPNKLECFENIRTLLNINDPIIDIKAEWFSKMKNLSVLVLGSLGFEDEQNKDVVNLKFLEELRNMKQLRLLSLQGIAAIKRLPDSVCELTNLKILNLSYCSNLEELPDAIGSLENLTHLDLTQCHILSKLPKGLRLLSKLEVLKGFVINYQPGGPQHKKACTLRDLLKLENLRKLSLVVNRDKFPDNEDLQVLMHMRKLCNLKITWQKNYSKNQQAPIEESGHSRWKMLKCWEPKTCRDDTNEPLGSNHFDNLEKLVLCCFPSETAPNWLDPSGMQNLEKLCIVGGNLKTLSGGTDQNTWNVKTIKLGHLCNLDMDWIELRRIFSSMIYCYKYNCDNLRNFPPKHTFEWKIEMKYDETVSF